MPSGPGHPLPEGEQDDEQAAFSIGRGRDFFLFTVDITGWGGDGAGLQVLPDATEEGVWLSYILFKSVACTDRVYSLDKDVKNGSGRRSTDIFRLRSEGNGADLAAWFSGTSVWQEQLEDGNGGSGKEVDAGSNRWLQLFLCAPQRFLAMVRLDLWELLLEGRRPEEMTADFFPHESSGRFQMEGWGEEGPSGQGCGVWVDVRMRLERDGGEGLSREVFEEGCRLPSLSSGSSPQRQALSVYTIAGAGQGKKSTTGSHPQGWPEEGGQEKGGEDEGGQDAEEEEEEEEEDVKERISMASAGDRHEHESSWTRDRPVGRRRFRLSLDLRAIRDLSEARLLYLAYHYPFLNSIDPEGSDGSDKKALDQAVASDPVLVPAGSEMAMDRSCWTYELPGRYDALEDMAARHPLIVSVMERQAGRKGADIEVGQVQLPLRALLKQAVTYRSAVHPRVFKTYAACRRFVERRSPLKAAPPPIAMRVIDTYLPVSGGDLRASLRAVLVLEDLGPAGEPPAQDASTHYRQRPRGTSLSATSPAPQPYQSDQESRPSATLPAPSTDTPVPPAASPSSAQPDLSAALSLLEVRREKLEFEDWRHRTEVEWSERLRAREAERLALLDQLHEKRESEQKAILKRGQAALARLERELRRRLGDVEGTERQQAAKEEEMKARAAQQVEECQSLQRRLRAEAKYQKEVEALRRRELEGQLDRLKEARQEAETRTKEVQEEYARFRRETRKNVPAALQAEVAALKGEKAELAARWERERAEKMQALLEKEQYRTALQRTARAWRRDTRKFEMALRRQAGDVRLEYLSREGQYRVDGRMEELLDIKRTLDAVRQSSKPPAVAMYNKKPPEAQQQPPQDALGVGSEGTGGGPLEARGRRVRPAPVKAVSRPPPSPASSSPGDKENLGASSTRWDLISSSSESKSGRSFLEIEGLADLEGAARGRGVNPPLSRARMEHNKLMRMMMSEDEEGETSLPRPHAEVTPAQSRLLLEETHRLRSERDLLLSTGNYGPEDPIIQTLTRLIQERESASAARAAEAANESQASTITFEAPSREAQSRQAV